MPRDPVLAKKYRGKECLICRNPSEGDHILPYKRWPWRDKEWNVWPLCRGHHTEKGMLPLHEFVERYGLENDIKEKGFFQLDNGNWWHEKAYKKFQ